MPSQNADLGMPLGLLCFERKEHARDYKKQAANKLRHPVKAQYLGSSIEEREERRQ